MPRISKVKAAAWLLFTLSVSVDVMADAFTSSVGPVAALPRTRRANDFISKSIPSGDGEGTLDDVIPLRGGSGDVSQTPPDLPTWKQFRIFALPCLGLWIAQPLLSLVDTAFVGLSGAAGTSASQLAALGPATTFFDGATYLFAFLNVATTNLYSSARAQRGEQSDKAESVVRTASRVAFKCGIGLMFFLLAFARPLLALYIGM
jgi:hypothetical protein